MEIPADELVPNIMAHQSLLLNLGSRIGLELKWNSIADLELRFYKDTEGSILPTHYFGAKESLKGTAFLCNNNLCNTHKSQGYRLALHRNLVPKHTIPLRHFCVLLTCALRNELFLRWDVKLGPCLLSKIWDFMMLFCWRTGDLSLVIWTIQSPKVKKSLTCHYHVDVMALNLIS